MSPAERARMLHNNFYIRTPKRCSGSGVGPVSPLHLLTLRLGFEYKPFVPTCDERGIETPPIVKERTLCA